MLLLTSAASTAVYAQLGDVPWRLAGLLMPLSFVATLAGQFAIDAVVAKLRRSSLVVTVLAVFFVVASSLTLAVAGRALAGLAANPGGALAARRVCGGSG